MSIPISQVLILDNGAHSIKIGLSTDPKPLIIPNCIVKVKSERRRPFIGDQLEECRDYSGIYYILPFDKGYLINWEVQLQIWDYAFKNKMNLVPDGKHRLSHVALIITEPVYNFTPIREYMLRYLFDEYGFGRILLTSAARLASLKYFHDRNNSIETGNIATKTMACLVVDSGYSFSHVVPFVEGHCMAKHMKRIDMGGKALTNHLKDILSYRQVNVLEETHVVNQMKEDCCFVSTQFWKDLKRAACKGRENDLAQDYILPDYVDFRRGFIYDSSKHEEKITAEHQRIRMNNERFQVAELLFNPCDVNIDQIGISHTIVHCVNEFHTEFAQNCSNRLWQALEAFEDSNKQAKGERSKYIDESEDEDEWELELEENIQDEQIEQEAKPKSKRKVQTTNSRKKKTSNDEDKPKEEEEDGVGKVKLIDQSIYENENIQSHLYNNIVLIGGNCRFPNFRDRVYSDVRTNVPDLFDLTVTLPSDPITYAWQGGALLAGLDTKGNPSTALSSTTNLLNRLSISQKEYRRLGITSCLVKYDHSQYPTF